MGAHKISRVVFAAMVGSLAMVATAQTVDSVGNYEVYAASTTHLIGSPPIGNASRVNAEGPSIAPTNVLEDVPRDTSAKEALVACTDTAAGRAPLACRRWLQIARTSE